MRRWLPFDPSRRGFLGAGLLAAGGAAISARNAIGQTGHDHGAAHSASHGEAAPAQADTPHHMSAHGAMITVGAVDSARNGFDPVAMLTDWYTGEVSTLKGARGLKGLPF